GEDRVFLREHVEGWEAVEADLRASDWDTLLGQCGLARADVERAVEMIVAARRGMCLWAMGLTHHQNGVDNVLALANVAAARGWIGRPGSGLLPIRGHSNVQGVGSVGFTPRLKETLSKQM